MKGSVLLDSDILIEVLRSRNRELLDRWEDLISGAGMLACSAITVAEIWHSVREPEHRIVLDMFSVLRSIPVSSEIGRQGGDYLHRFHASHGLELGGALIAATASVHELHLWTRNRRHYPMRDVRFY